MLLSADLLVFLYLLTFNAKHAFGAPAPPRAQLHSSSAAKANALLDEAYGHALSEYGNNGFEYWKGLMGQSPIIFSHPNDPKKQVEISPIWDPSSEPGVGGPIRVLVSLLHATGFGIQLPIRSFLVYPDGTVVRTERD